MHITSPFNKSIGLKIRKIALDKECGSNLISAYRLARQGYNHVKSRDGEFCIFSVRKGSFYLQPLGHVHKARLLAIFSNGLVEGIPQIPQKDLPFFCATCEIANSMRMSYRNKIGSRSRPPLHALHMDTTGKIKVNGRCGGFGYAMHCQL
ncbi:hypothetical protein PHYSODRAFT_526670 [Phytophthora sojae]|uniref:GAG-pre-integrase domain-containing protein n=1 Tax=Phytophthora sojae (strain P6497) TaxID=1094619 RepID=G5A7N5_PHYSP|nr:hypothetical protein PHYSODRAFT_526670 [Phytophthora sojae]EGZ07911.1 hypothetical protein PHYSODRAFT_526670 [Phytophthora sojae]|eukprot:XP_009536083.1 hypothetical protein PHYSODRAFT_526670 [Phytophthora sojae]